jgi:heavy metal translocating P-type ATPase
MPPDQQPPDPSFRDLLTSARRREAGRIVLVGLMTLLYWTGLLPRWLLFAAVALGLYPLVKTGVEDLVREHKVGTELFVTLATLIALAGGEYVAASVLMTIILIAEFVADFNTDRARASIQALVGATPRTAVVREPNGERVVPIEELSAGTIVLVRAGEKIPVDGTVVTGSAAVNEASITGESLPVEKSVDGSVLAGTLVESGAIDVRTDKVGPNTMFARIVALVEKAESEAAPVQKLTDRIAAWLLPAVAVFLAIVFVLTRDVRKIVTLLIFTSPAELGLATPMVMIAAIARAARLGILVRGGLYLEQLAKVDTVVFDKTGTLTIGEPRLCNVWVVGNELKEDSLLRYAASADTRSGHPLARAVVTEAHRRGIDIPEPQDFRTIHGRGVIAVVEAREVMVGNKALMEEHAVLMSDHGELTGMSVQVAINGRLAGSLQFLDEIRPRSAEVIRGLKATGINRIVMLTGDSVEAARQVGIAIGIDDVRARLLPQDKITEIERLQQGGHLVAMVGDGVNDAPALARADVGIAMGARGTEAALEAADIALMTDDLTKLVLARLLARRAMRTIKENVIGGVGVVHVLGITAALFGWIGPIQAAMLHLGPDVLVFVNSVKLLRVRLDKTPRLGDPSVEAPGP